MGRGGDLSARVVQKSGSGGPARHRYLEEYGGFEADVFIRIIFSEELGGAGFMRGSRAERIYREVKVMMIGGGAEEIMKDLAAKQLGY